ncbi:hypothetical protein BH11PLA1_BH11PLA1_01240 [soil metagenome]
MMMKMVVENVSMRAGHGTLFGTFGGIFKATG